jgi:hypothetical protein
MGTAFDINVLLHGPARCSAPPCPCMSTCKQLIGFLWLCIENVAKHANACCVLLRSRTVLVLDVTSRRADAPCGPAVRVGDTDVPGTIASCCRAAALQYLRLLTSLGAPEHQARAQPMSCEYRQSTQLDSDAKRPVPEEPRKAQVDSCRLLSSAHSLSLTPLNTARRRRSQRPRSTGSARGLQGQGARQDLAGRRPRAGATAIVLCRVPYPTLPDPMPRDSPAARAGADAAAGRGRRARAQRLGRARAAGRRRGRGRARRLRRRRRRRRP